MPCPTWTERTCCEPSGSSGEPATDAREGPPTPDRHPPRTGTIVAFCEGEVTEPDYLNALKRLPEVRANTAITIEIEPGRDVPLPLVNRAIERSRDDEVDECWCLFDVEWPRNHPRLREAVQLAQARGIRLAISNPCFELWLALHFEPCTAVVDTAAAESRSRHLDGRQGKRIEADQYMERRHLAAARASDLQKRHERDGTTFPMDNPSSTMFEFLAAIEPVARRADNSRPGDR